ncbi:MAG: contractile injection system protein, VgrG/Pvc8 family [Vicinamibacterales bacterium]
MPTPPLATPRPALFVDGVDNPAFAADLLGLVVEESLSAPSRCTVRLRNVSGRPGGDFTWPAGRDLRAHADFWRGIPPTTLVRMFEGRVYEIGGGFPAQAVPEFVVGAEDGLAAFRQSHRTRVFEAMTDVQIATAIAAEPGLQVDVRVSATLPVHARTAQLAQSDAAFLADRAAAAGAQMWIEGGTLVVADAPEGEGDTLAYGTTLESFVVGADVRGQRTSMQVTGWDPQGKQALLGSAVEADLPVTPASGPSGPRVLQQAFGPAVEAVATEVPASSVEARSLAVAHLRARAARFVTGHGECTGAVTMRAGRAVTLQGLGPLFSGSYQVTAVRHVFTPDAGWRTSVEVRRPRPGHAGKARTPEETAHATRDSGHDRPREDTGRTRRTSPGPARRRRR